MQWTVAIGVDTHKDLHVAVALDGLGAQLDSREIATTPAGYRSLLSWAQELGVPAFAIEGTGSYGAGLVRFLERAGVAVYECERPRRQERRRGKSDLIDAALAARRLLAGERLSLPRGGGRREDLRLLLLERRSAMQARSPARARSMPRVASSDATGSTAAAIANSTGRCTSSPSSGSATTPRQAPITSGSSRRASPPGKRAA